MYGDNLLKVSKGDWPPSSEQHNLHVDYLRRQTRMPGVYVDNLGALGVVAAVPGLLEPVTVSNDGGTAGAPDPAGSNCSFTYTLTNLEGAELATTITPQQARYPKTTYLAAGTGGRSQYALAYNLQGTWLLLWLPGEIADATVCP